MNNCCQPQKNAPLNKEQTAQKEREVQFYQPDVNIYENDDQFVLVADLPGSAKDDLDLEFEKGTLTIKGKVGAREGANVNYLLNEFGVADYFRSFEFGDLVDGQGLSAEFTNGVLTVTLKKPKSQALRKIPITTEN
jgi:HSP20 family molecular chaperone IbpA